MKVKYCAALVIGSQDAPACMQRACGRRGGGGGRVAAAAVVARGEVIKQAGQRTWRLPEAHHFRISCWPGKQPW